MAELIILYDFTNNVYEQLSKYETSTILPVLVRFWSTGNGAMICLQHPLVDSLGRAEADIGEALPLSRPR